MPFKTESLSHEDLLAQLHYDPETGVFTNIKTGRQYVNANDEGYIRIQLRGVSYLGARLAWFYVHKEWPNPSVDHINRDRADNRISNLRVANRNQQRVNAKCGNSIGIKNISLQNNRFFVIICDNKKNRVVGTFTDIHVALAARNLAAKEVHGEFATEEVVPEGFPTDLIKQRKTIQPARNIRFEYNKYRVVLERGGRVITVGKFATLDEAIRARDAAEKENKSKRRLPDRSLAEIKQGVVAQFAMGGLF